MKMRVLEFTIRKLSELKEKLEKRDHKINTHFTPLSPTDTADDSKEYLDAIEWALDNDKIKNVAITGPYGSGKSSVIQTFQKKYRYSEKFKFLNISLATFKDRKAENGAESIDAKDGEDVLRLIELSVLQQIFYREADSSIPDSRFSKIEKRNKWMLAFSAASTVAFICAYCYLFLPEEFGKISLFVLGDGWKNGARIASVLIVFVWLFYSSYKIMFFVKSLALTRVGFKDAEIEIDEKISKSILNKHLDEILYFFEATSNNVVVIEDLDRFEQTEVFTKLRELNLLLNNSKKIIKRIVFLYAIKDEMFLNKDRAKFFDFIIPIVPVINSSNSSEKLRLIVDKNKYHISQRLIEDVSLFIDDMRLLYNVMNEYYIYSKKINSSLNQDNLLAMIIYKNIYPNDFSCLSKREGVLYGLISRKNEFLKKSTEKFDTDILEEKTYIKLIEDSRIREVKELRAIYLNKIIEKILEQGFGFYSFYINNQLCSVKDVLADDKFNFLVSNLRGLAYCYNPSQHQSNVNFAFDVVEKEVSTETYKKRLEVLLELNSTSLNARKHKIQSMEIKKEELKKLAIGDLIKSSDIAADVFFGAQKQQDLLSMLLRQGYIGEDYFDYVSIFYEGSISRSDFEFLIGVKVQRCLDFDYKLEKIENLIKRINPYDFEKRIILNYSLLEYLLNSNDFRDELTRFVKFLSNETEDSISFIDGFLSFTLQQEKFVRLLCSQWHKIWSVLSIKPDYLDDKMSEYFRLIIEYADIRDISEIFKESPGVFDHQKSFLVMSKNLEKIKYVIRAFSLKLKNISHEVPPVLLEYIYSESAYEITLENLRTIFEFKKAQGFDCFNRSNYKCIRESGLQNMIDYIDENLEEYIESAYLRIDPNKDEPEKYVLDILNSENVRSDTKKKFLQHTTTELTSVEHVESEDVLDIILFGNKFVASWENVADVFERKKGKIDDALVTFLNDEKNSDFLSKKKISKEYPNGEKAKKFISAILHTESISIESYQKFIPKVPYVYSRVNFDELDAAKVGVLLKNQTLSPTTENFTAMKEHFFDLRIKLLEKQSKEKIELLLNDFQVEDIIEIVSSKGISLDVKTTLVFHKGIDFVCSDQKLLDKLCLLLLTEEVINFEEEMLRRIIIKGNIDSEEKIGIFLKYQNVFSKIDCESFLKTLDEPYSLIAEKGKVPKINKTDNNNKFVEVLLEKQVVSSVKESLFGKIQINTFKN